MKKIISILIAVILMVSSCASIDTVPSGTFYRLDEKSVKYITDNPEINLSDYGSQSSRNSELPETEFLVATSGGGQRAAAFTMGVLAELERLGEYSSRRSSFNALAEIDYFSSVSGGAWATGAYITSLLEFQSYNSSQYSLTQLELEKIESRIRKLEMSFSSNCLISKIDNNITSIDGRSIKLGDIFVDKSQTPTVPYAFYNSTIQSTHGPFVFEKSHILKHKIKKFNYCGKSNIIDFDVNNIPLSVAVGTSSSVPGFRFTQAHSLKCEDEDMKGSFICSENRQFMHLFDGGVFDNLGYKTGIEVLSQTGQKKNKVMLVIDANADTYLPFEKHKTSEWLMFIDTGMKSTLAANAVTANKSLESVSKAFSITPITLSFSSASGFLEKSQKVKEITGRDPMTGLYALQKFVQIDSDNSKLLCEYDKAPIDCDNNKYYRVGLSSKTSHMIDHHYYTALQDLGRLVVRLNAEKIFKILNQSKPLK
jgi:predicted acylesterase/phospholipase RssA